MKNCRMVRDDLGLVQNFSMFMLASVNTYALELTSEPIYKEE